MPSASRMKHRVTLRKPTTVKNSHNEDVTTLTDAATVWAQVIRGSTREFFEGDQRVAEGRVAVRIRYRSDIDETWSLVIDAVKYKISGIQEQGRRKGLEIQAYRDGK